MEDLPAAPILGMIGVATVAVLGVKLFLWCVTNWHNERERENIKYSCWIIGGVVAIIAFGGC